MCFCYGDTIERNGSSERKDGTRGMFQSRYQRTFKDAADGLSNTILMSEVGTDDGTVKVQGWIANDCPNPSQAGGLREVRKLVRNGLYLNATLVSRGEERAGPMDGGLYGLQHRPTSE